jgi:hypothetical protein
MIHTKPAEGSIEKRIAPVVDSSGAILTNKGDYTSLARS